MSITAAQGFEAGGAAIGIKPSDAPSKTMPTIMTATPGGISAGGSHFTSAA